MFLGFHSSLSMCSNYTFWYKVLVFLLSDFVRMRTKLLCCKFSRYNTRNAWKLGNKRSKLGKVKLFFSVESRMSMLSFLNGAVTGFYEYTIYDLLEHERLQISSFIQVKKNSENTTEGTNINCN
jgi:hypothetical protein